MNFSKFSLTLPSTHSLTFDSANVHPASINPVIGFGEDNYEQSDHFTEDEITTIIKKERLSPSNIFKTYDEILNPSPDSKFKFNYIGDTQEQGGDMFEKMKEIRNKIINFDGNQNTKVKLHDGTVMHKKDRKKLYEIGKDIPIVEHATTSTSMKRQNVNHTISIDSPSYIYVDSSNNLYKIYAISLIQFDGDGSFKHLMYNKEFLLFLATVKELMSLEYRYHKQAYELVKENDTTRKMVSYIKNEMVKDSSSRKSKITFSHDKLKESYEAILKKINETVTTERYNVIIPELYDTNMDRKEFYYDKDSIYYFMKMTRVPNTNTTKLQSIKECMQIKPLISVIDAYLIMNGLSHNDYYTKGNVFVDVKNKNIYIIDFGAAGDYVFNSALNVILSNNINSLNITCDNQSSKIKSAGHAKRTKNISKTRITSQKLKNKTRRASKY